MVTAMKRGSVAAIAASGIPRQDIFVTTNFGTAITALTPRFMPSTAACSVLALEQLDLYLIHWPVPVLTLMSIRGAAFARLKSEKRVRSIGVSNFNANHLERIISETG